MKDSGDIRILKVHSIVMIYKSCDLDPSSKYKPRTHDKKYGTKSTSSKPHIKTSQEWLRYKNQNVLTCWLPMTLNLDTIMPYLCIRDYWCKPFCQIYKRYINKHWKKILLLQFVLTHTYRVASVHL